MHPRRIGSWQDRLAPIVVALGLVLLLLPRPTRFAIAVRLQTVLLAPLRALEDLQSETRYVRQENERLARLAAELALENARLQTLARVESRPPLTGRDLIRAPVISRDLATLRRYLVVSRGSGAGISPGTPALTPEGVVGLVTATTARQSLIQTLFSPESRVPVTNRRSRVPAIARALSTGLLALDYVPKEADFRAGDTLVTAGLGGIFPSGLRVAVITLAREDPTALFKTVRCRPLARIATLEHVFLLLVPKAAAANPEDDWLDNLAPTDSFIPHAP